MRHTTLWVVLVVMVALTGACGDKPVVEEPVVEEPVVEEPVVEEEVSESESPARPDPREGEPVVVTGPLTEGRGISLGAPQDLEAFGYVEEEFLFEGEAVSYRLVGERSADGHWEAEPADTAAFRTRMIVRRPVDASSFSGVVVVEWFNVSSGTDRDPDWSYLYREITREGHAYVGVSAQAVGAIGGEPAVSGAERTGGLRGTDGERYGTIEHPGDA